MKATRNQINLAGRLWTLAMACSIQPSDHREGKRGGPTADSDQKEILGNRVRMSARNRAMLMLAALGTAPGLLRTDLECLAEAMRLKPHA